MEAFLQSPVGAEFCLGLVITDVTALMAASQKTRNAFLQFARVVAFAASRPVSGKLYSLHAWSNLLQAYLEAAKDKDVNWSGKELNLGISRITWTPDGAPETAAVAVRALPPQNFFPLLETMWWDCWRNLGIRSIDSAGTLQRVVNRAWNSDVVVIALKGTFAYVQDSEVT